MSKTFSLEGRKLKFKKTVGKRPKRYIVNRNKANLDIVFVTRVFMALSVILFDTEQDTNRKAAKATDLTKKAAKNAAEAADMAKKAKEVVSKIDLKSCYALLLNYTDPDSPDLENILSDTNWIDPEYNGSLLQKIRFETESFVF